MRLFLTVMFTAAALLFQPVADQAFGHLAVRPNLCLAPLAIALSLCPGATAVICCGILGLILDCLAGPQLGARAACFCLLSALGSMTVGRRADSWPGRVAAWGAILFVAEMLSRIIACSSLGGTFRPAAAAFDAALSAMATTILLCGLWMAGQLLLSGPRSARSIRRLAPAIGRASSGN